MAITLGGSADEAAWECKCSAVYVAITGRTVSVEWNIPVLGSHSLRQLPSPYLAESLKFLFV